MLKELQKSIVGGFLIGLSGYISLMCDNKYIASILFCIGLYIICTYQLNLYTGAIGYLKIPFDKKYIGKLLVILIGNIIGCYIVAIFPITASAQETLNNIMLQKDITTAFHEAFLCGCLMFLAVNTYKIHKTSITIFLCVPAFILSGMEHSIANTYYVLLSDALEFIPYIIVCILGNSLGAICMRKLIS